MLGINKGIEYNRGTTGGKVEPITTPYSFMCISETDVDSTIFQVAPLKRTVHSHHSRTEAFPFSKKNNLSSRFVHINQSTGLILLQ